MKPDTYHRARISILSELLSFPTIRSGYWSGTGFSDNRAMVGDLVAMSSAPASKWYLSWVRDIKPGIFPNYLLESIDDGELCWWSNIEVYIYDRQRVSNSPSWKWTDRQFQFNDRWHRTCKKNDAYIVLPCPAVFDDLKVLLSLRIRHGFDEGFQHQQVFDDFRKVTIPMLDSFYKAGAAKYQQGKAA